MARILVGDDTRVDADVLAAVQTLSDEFFVFLEFDVAGRQVDVMILRPRPVAACTLIITEIKRIGRPVRGTDNGVWETETDDGSWMPLPTRYRDKNPYKQVVNTADVVAEWLWNNQRTFCDPSETTLQKSAFRLWPDLLILSRAEIEHRLPLGPSSRFGRWFHNANAWIDHVASWTPRPDSVVLTPDDVARLAEVLGLTSVCPSYPELSRQDAPEAAAGLEALVQWCTGIEKRLRSVELRVHPDGGTSLL